MSSSHFLPDSFSLSGCPCKQGKHQTHGLLLPSIKKVIPTQNANLFNWEISDPVRGRGKESFFQSIQLASAKQLPSIAKRVGQVRFQDRGDGHIGKTGFTAAMWEPIGLGTHLYSGQWKLNTRQPWERPCMPQTQNFPLVPDYAPVTDKRHYRSLSPANPPTLSRQETS